MSKALHRTDLVADAWEAFAIATLIRESLSLRGSDDAAGLTLRGNAQEAVVLALDRVVTLTRSVATTCGEALSHGILQADLAGGEEGG